MAEQAGPGSGAVSWAQFEQEAPELAATVRERFAVRKHCTMATLRRDGSPRISGTEMELADGQVRIGSMPGARKAVDLLRDPRVALHSPTVDPPEGQQSSWAGEAKLAGVAAEERPAEAQPAEQEAAEQPPGGHTFRVDLTEVVHTRVDGDSLVVTSWHPGRGVQVTRRQ